MTEKVEKTTIVCRIKNSEFVQCDFYLNDKYLKTLTLSKKKLEDLIK